MTKIAIWKLNKNAIKSFKLNNIRFWIFFRILCHSLRWIFFKWRSVLYFFLETGNRYRLNTFYRNLWHKFAIHYDEERIKWISLTSFDKKLNFTWKKSTLERFYCNFFEFLIGYLIWGVDHFLLQTLFLSSNHQILPFYRARFFRARYFSWFRTLINKVILRFKWASMRSYISSIPISKNWSSLNLG